MTDNAGKSFIDLTANIVSAYVSNNSTPASEIPALISQIHGGEMSVQSKVDEGTTVTILLPLSPTIEQRTDRADNVATLTPATRHQAIRDQVKKSA